MSDSNRSDTDGLTVAVSGGSMGGLFAGLALRDAGHAVEIFEQSTGELASRGAGIVAQPRMLDFMDEQDIAAPNEITTTTAPRQFLDPDGGVERERTEEMTFTSWDGIYRRLRDAFPDENYHMGRSTVGAEQSDETATFRFADDTTMRADLAVVAEGGQSATRADLLPDVEPEYAGYVAWRGVVAEESVPSTVREQFEDTFTFHERSDDLVLGYPIPGPDGGTDDGERRLNWVWYDNVRDRDERRRLLTDPDGIEHGFSVPPGRLRPTVEDELLAAADRFPEVFTDLVAATDDPFVQAIYDLRVPAMVFSRVCLLGDCAFVARPHTAAGTAKAAADGIELATALDTNEETTAALREWESSRLDAGRRLVARGQRMGDGYMD